MNFFPLRSPFSDFSNVCIWSNNPVSGFPVHITLTMYGYSTGYKKNKKKLEYSTNNVFLSENTINWFCFPVQITLTRYGYSTAGVSKWAGTRYFYPPEIVYSTVRNY